MNSCQECGKEMKKKSNDSYLQYKKRMFCSISCRFKKGMPESTKRKLSLACKNKKVSSEMLKVLRTNWVGRKHSVETRRKMSESSALRGSRNPIWKDGISSLNKQLRDCLEYRLWREAVFKRDDYTCRFCGIRGHDLHADHITAFAYLIDYIRHSFRKEVWFKTALEYKPLWDISNGRTLCVSCHRKTPTYAKNL